LIMVLLFFELNLRFTSLSPDDIGNRPHCFPGEGFILWDEACQALSGPIANSSYAYYT